MSLSLVTSNGMGNGSSVCAVLSSLDSAPMSHFNKRGEASEIMKKQYKESEYSKKLKDPRWQKMRLEILQRDDFTCQSCGDSEETLHVHHLVYRSWGTDPWESDASELLTLCEPCHTIETEEMPKVKKLFVDAFAGLGFLSRELSTIAYGLSHGRLPHAPEVTASVIEQLFLDTVFQQRVMEIFHQRTSERIEEAKASGNWPLMRGENG